MALSESTRDYVLSRDDYTCGYCRTRPDELYRPVTRRRWGYPRYQSFQCVLHVDHIFPRSKGGTDKLSNLATACETCNTAKGARIWAPPFATCLTCEARWEWPTDWVLLPDGPAGTCPSCEDARRELLEQRQTSWWILPEATNFDEVAYEISCWDKLAEAAA